MINWAEKGKKEGGKINLKLDYGERGEGIKK